MKEAAMRRGGITLDQRDAIGAPLVKKDVPPTESANDQPCGCDISQTNRLRVYGRRQKQAYQTQNLQYYSKKGFYASYI